MKSGRMRRGGGGHVARMGERRGVLGFCLGNQREIDHLENSGVNGRIIILALVPCIQIRCTK